MVENPRNCFFFEQQKKLDLISKLLLGEAQANPKK